MSIVFKKATLDDCMELSKMKKIMWEYTYRGIYQDEDIDNYDYENHKKKFESKIKGNEIFYWIGFDDEICGYFSIGIPRYKYKNFSLSLNSLYILPSYQRKGIGKEVFKFINNYCRENNLDKFMTCCNFYNKNAYSFYSKMGGIVGHVDNNGSDKAAHQYYIEYYIK